MVHARLVIFMADLKPLPPQLANKPGVAFLDPPAGLILDVARHVNEALATLPADANGALVAIGTDVGVNVAIIHKVNDKFAVAAWIAKSWGSKVQGGAMVRATW